MGKLQEIPQPCKAAIINFTDNSIKSTVVAVDALMQILALYSIRYNKDNSKVLDKLMLSIKTGASIMQVICANKEGEHYKTLDAICTAIKNIEVIGISRTNSLLKQYEVELTSLKNWLTEYLSSETQEILTPSSAEGVKVVEDNAASIMNTDLFEITENIDNDQQLGIKNLEIVSLYIIKQLFITLCNNLEILKGELAPNVIKVIEGQLAESFPELTCVDLNSIKIIKVLSPELQPSRWLPSAIKTTNNLSTKLAVYKIYKELDGKIKELDRANEGLKFAIDNGLISQDIISSTPKLVEDVEESLENAKSTMKSCAEGAKYLWNVMKNIFVSTCCDTVDCCEPKCCDTVDCCEPKCYDPSGCCDHKDHAQIIQHDQPLDVNLTVLTDSPQV